MKKALNALVTPTFAQIKVQFVNSEEKNRAEMRLTLNYVSKHAKCLKETTKKPHKILGKSMTIKERSIFKYLLNKIMCTSKRKRMDSCITKSKKLDRLITYIPSITPD